MIRKFLLIGLISLISAVCSVGAASAVPIHSADILLGDGNRFQLDWRINTSATFTTSSLGEFSRDAFFDSSVTYNGSTYSLNNQLLYRYDDGRPDLMQFGFADRNIGVPTGGTLFALQIYVPISMNLVDNLLPQMPLNSITSRGVYILGGSPSTGTVASLTYSEPQVSAVPLPAALPLYGAGLAIMGLVGWRRKRKVEMA